jgi:hypothetical protein
MANDPWASCRFLVPGTYGVTARVTGAAGATTAAAEHVTVVIEGGYVVLRVAPNIAQTADIERALLHAVDWVAVHEKASRLLVFHDPDSGHAVYAAALRPGPVVNLSSLESVKVRLPFAQGGAVTLIREALEAAGPSMQVMPEVETIMAFRAGAGAVGLVSVDRPG